MTVLGTVSSRCRTRQRGQTMVLFVVFLVALIGFGALAVGVASVYALQRMERSVADASALAGAQDLQTPNGRSDPSTTQQQRARYDALNRAWLSLGGSAADFTTAVAGACTPTADIVNCQVTGTSYQVSIKTPSPSVMQADAIRAVQVTVRQPSDAVPFAGLFGQGPWNVAITSVAALTYPAQYALVTLRPPQPLHSSDQNYKDVFIDGGTVVRVYGDVGTNTNVFLQGTWSALKLESNFKVYYYDTYTAWTPPPPGQQLPTWIPDPDYATPSRAGAPPGVQDTPGCAAAIQAAASAGYVGHSSSIDPSQTYTLTIDNTTCYKPGIYTTNIGQNVGNTEAVLLEPGVYFFDGGLSMNGTLIGGYSAGSFDSAGNPTDHTGVSLVFPEANSVNQGAFAGNSATLVSLNAGECVKDLSAIATCTTYASPAQDWVGALLGVSFKTATSNTVVPESLIVFPKASGCIPGFTESVACQDNQNNTIALPGGGDLLVMGVQYAPTDNIKVSGNATGEGYVGQIIAWTVHYTGGSKVGEIYPGQLGNGVLRLDEACSGPGTICNP